MASHPIPRQPTRLRIDVPPIEGTIGEPDRIAPKLIATGSVLLGLGLIFLAIESAAPTYASR